MSKTWDFPALIIASYVSILDYELNYSLVSSLGNRRGNWGRSNIQGENVCVVLLAKGLGDAVPVWFSLAL